MEVFSPSSSKNEESDAKGRLQNPHALCDSLYVYIPTSPWSHIMRKVFLTILLSEVYTAAVSLRGLPRLHTSLHLARRREQDMRLEWALHVIPCVAMLYLMRKAGEPSSASSSSATPTAGKEYGGGDERTGLSGAVVEDGYGEYAPGSNRYRTGGYTS